MAYKYKIPIDQFISAAGYGKGIIDRVNGVKKPQLTIESARELKNATEVDDLRLKKFSRFVKKHGAVFSTSIECKRLIEIDDNEGIKSDKKYAKREINRGIKQVHYHIRQLKEKLPSIKYCPLKLPKGYKVS